MLFYVERKGETTPLWLYDSLHPAGKGGFLKTKLNIPPDEQPFIVNKTIQDGERAKQTHEAVNTMPFCLTAADYEYVKGEI